MNALLKDGTRYVSNSQLVKLRGREVLCGFT